MLEGKGGETALMEPGVRNLAFLQLSTAGGNACRWKRGERRKEPGAWTKRGGGLESEGKGETTHFGLKNTLRTE